MNSPSFLSFSLGLVIFAFLICSVLIVPFINILYKLHFTRRAEAPKHGKIPLFDKLHDIKAGTPVGGGVLLILLVTLFFAILFPIASYLGVYIKTAYNLRWELIIIFFTFISFGILGFSDDFLKLFVKPTKGVLGLWFGLRRRQKFILQWILAFAIGYMIYAYLGVHIIHVPLVNKVLDFGVWYVPLSAFVIVTFSNAFNITDGLDGLATGLLLICLVAFGIIVSSRLDTPLSLFISLWAGCLMAFLYFNIWPARIFMGDTGALSFGATLAVIGLLTGSIFALIVMGGIFILEVASSAIQILSWKFRNKPFFTIAPVHNAFLAKDWEEPKIVMRAWLLGLILAIFGLWLSTI